MSHKPPAFKEGLQIIGCIYSIQPFNKRRPCVGYKDMWTPWNEHVQVEMGLPLKLSGNVCSSKADLAKRRMKSNFRSQGTLGTTASRARGCVVYDPGILNVLLPGSWPQNQAFWQYIHKQIRLSRWFDLSAPCSLLLMNKRNEKHSNTFHILQIIFFLFRLYLDPNYPPAFLERGQSAWSSFAPKLLRARGIMERRYNTYKHDELKGKLFQVLLFQASRYCSDIVSLF